MADTKPYVTVTPYRGRSAYDAYRCNSCMAHAVAIVGIEGTKVERGACPRHLTLAKRRAAQEIATGAYRYSVVVIPVAGSPTATYGVELDGDRFEEEFPTRLAAQKFIAAEVRAAA